MPINYKDYPADWKAIRRRILARAERRCEHCGLRNYSVGYRQNGEFHPLGGNYSADAAGAGQSSSKQAGRWVESLNNCLFGRRRCDDEGRHWFMVVLTIAHLDHDATNHEVADERLAALCQQCHNRLDMKERARKRAGLANLFAAATIQEGKQS